MKWVNASEIMSPIDKRICYRVKWEGGWYHFTATRILDNHYQRLFPIYRLNIPPEELEWLDESPTIDSIRVQAAKDRHQRDQALKQVETLTRLLKECNERDLPRVVEGL